MTRSTRMLAALLALMALLAAACGDDDGEAGAGDRPVVVVTTNILGDVVENLAGGQVDVVTIMPVGADPHDFQASAQQVAQIGAADVLVVNGAGFEEGLVDVIEAAEGDGVPTFEAISAVATLDGGEHGHHDEESHHDDEEEGHHDEDEEGHDDGDAHDHGDGVDPHFFTDPARMAVAAEAIADFLIANIDAEAGDALGAIADAYVAELTALDTEVEGLLGEIPEDQRTLVTNHEVFAYFADRYGFEIVGTIIPAASTTEGVSAQALAELAETVEREGVPAIFADTSASAELADTLAAEVGDVAVVELFSESLGADDSEGASFVEMIRTNARRIAAALAG